MQSPEKASKLFSYLAIISAVIAAGLTYSFLAGLEQKATGTVTAAVAVADIPENTLLNKSAVRLVSVPARLADAQVISDGGQVEGMVTKVPLNKGEVVFASKVQAKGEFGSVAFDTKAGDRAFTINGEKLISMPENLREGDRLDVAASFAPDVFGAPTAGVILENIKVLAVGLKADQNMLSSKSQETFTVSSVTLSVRPEDVAKLAFAQGQGSVILVARNSKDQGKINPYSIGPDGVFR